VELGKHLRELFELRFAVVVCIVLATLAGISISYKAQLDPPGLTPRSIQIASATSEVLVDTPFSTAVDLRQGRTDLENMSARATLLGNVIASPPVLEYIAQRAHVSAASIRAQPPLTPDFPRPIPKPGEERSAKDILKAPDEYRINVQVDPSVPILRVIAQAPEADKAETLANGAIDGLNDYLDAVAAREATPAKDRIRLERLGRSKGVVINGGVRLQASAVAFLIVFGLSAAAAIFIGRVRRGWREAGPSEAEGHPDDPAPAEFMSARERTPAKVR
jgi:hypothetical protein